MRKKNKFSFVVDNDTAEWLRKTAEISRRTVSDLIRLLLLGEKKTAKKRFSISTERK